MKMLGKAGIVLVMVLAFLVYFLSESMLRQATVSNINPQSVNVDSLMTKLPASMRDTVNNKIENTRLRNAVKFAGTDSEKVVAIVNLAERSKDAGRKLWLYSELLKEYPSNPESYVVYSRYMLNEGDGPNFTISDYQSFVLLFDQITAYNMWIAGVNRLLLLKVSMAEEMKFLEPLLSIKPEYREYGRIYQEIARLADRDRQPDKKSVLADRADAIAESCKKLPTIDEVIKKRAEAALKASSKDGKAAQSNPSGKGG